MRKILLLLSICFLIATNSPSVRSLADESFTYYAKVLSSANFYQSADENSALFALPSTYFVLLVGEEGDFYRAKYLDIFGYVKKDEVTPMQGTPTSPYPNQTFRNFNDNGLTLYSSATTQSSPLGKLAFEGEYTLYGTKIGEEMFPQSTNIWYYCRLDSESGTVFGYAFSYYCDMFTGFAENTEYFPEITGSLQFSAPEPEPQGGLSDTVIAIIVLSVSLPCLVILYLLLSPSSKLKKRFAKRKDYYEFNEEDL